MFSSKTLTDIYPEFSILLTNCAIEEVGKYLNKYPSLATYYRDDVLPPVFAAIFHSFTHIRVPQLLDLLKNYKADFNAEFYVKNDGNLKIDCNLNPLAFLLFRGGDKRLIEKLIACGTDKNHPSIAKISEIIEANKDYFYFDENDKRQEHDTSSFKLVSKL